MKLSVGKIYDIYAALAKLERDDKIKLLPDVRLKMAINLNRLQNIASAYERTRTRALADLHAANRKLEGREQRLAAEIEADFLDQNESLRTKEEEIELKKLSRQDFKLDENTGIGAQTLAWLFPIVDGLED